MNNLFPLATTNGNAGLFADPTSYGLVQGQDYSDPSTNFRLRGGVIAASETLPMWGGLPLYQSIPVGPTNSGPLVAMGPQVGRATTVTGGSKPIMAWSVFQQNYSWVNQPGSTAPQGAPGQSVNYYPAGSLARIVVAADPELIDIQGDLTNVAVAWDFVNGMLVPYTGSINVGTGNTYNSTTGLVTLNLASDPDISPGDSVTVAGLAGSGSFAAADGTHTAGAGTGGTVLTYTIATGLTMTISDSTGTVTTGTSLATLATPFNVLDVQVSNCVTVGFNATTGATNWEFSGACAVIQI